MESVTSLSSKAFTTACLASSSGSGGITVMVPTILASWKYQRRHLCMNSTGYSGLRARAALAEAGRDPKHSKKWLGRAEADAKRLAAEGACSALGLSALVFGGVYQARGKTREAVRSFDAARLHFLAQGMKLHASIALLARAIVSSDERDLARGNEELLRLGVVAPSRMLDLWVPGLRRFEPRF